MDKIKKQVRQKHPQPPFITSTSSRRRLRAAVQRQEDHDDRQQLYEGVSLAGGEVTGLITYMRTDSPVVSGEAIGQARSFIPRPSARPISRTSPGSIGPKSRHSRPTRPSGPRISGIPRRL